ncbi:MAG: (2Fe-2S)-binding protein [Armatimonadetes bacterium]|nr:(2Fe-2S)-binding protein [Armatimonadota bacterium]MCX7968988.1 (2Fe-2S)-binding protein [Armatimonadota bacterium]MDW8142987.1 (2Fe-2S)-binding protein [Armatimonadota bacterium]
MANDGKERKGVSRREFLKVTGAGAALTELLTVKTEEAASAPPAKVVRVPKNRTVPVTLRVNGKVYKLQLEPRVTLLDALRNHLNLTGTKKVCNRGECGACTVLMDGKPVNSCMILAVDAEGHDIVTIEGLAKGGKLHPVQEAFVEHDAMQCGFCTPGFIMAAVGLLNQNKAPTLDEIRSALSGNLCRCGVYPRIFAAVADAAKRMRSGA